MLKFAALSLAALAASTAYAQTPEAAPAPSDPAATSGAPAASSAPAASDPNAAASLTAEAAPAPASANAQVVAVVEAGFPKYDADKDGKLSQAEFKQWISDLKTQELAASGKAPDPAAVAQYASAALAAADRDKDGVVTKQDLTAFLGG